MDTLVPSGVRLVGPLEPNPAPAEPSEHFPRLRPRVVGGAVFVFAATALQLLRQSGVPLWRTVWGEDGAVFYIGAVNQPLRETVLRDYAGYAHVVPRAIAALGVHLPLGWYSAFIAIVTTLIVALLSLFVYYASGPLLRSPLRQSVLAGSMILLPSLPLETLGAAANLQWNFTLPCLFAVLMPVERMRTALPYLVVAVLAPLTGPLCLMFLPVAAFRIARHYRARTSRGDLVVPIAYLAGCLLQALVVVTSDTTHEARPPLDAFARDLSRLYATRVSTELALGVRVTRSLWPSMGYWLALLTLTAIAVVVVWKLRRSTASARLGIALSTIASGVSFAIEWAQRGVTMPATVSRASLPYNFGSSRFGLFPMYALLLALLIPSNLPRGAVFGCARSSAVSLTEDLRRSRLLLVVTSLWIIVAIVPSFRTTNERSKGPDFVRQVDAAETACAAVVPHMEPIEISPRGWSIVLACDELRRRSGGG
jgi:hypothetical protein